MLNREQRRKYSKKIRHDKIASICPECNMKARFVTTRRKDEETAIVCEVCGKIIRQGPEITKSVPAGIYLPVPISTLDMMIEAVKAEEEKKNES